MTQQRVPNRQNMLGATGHNKQVVPRGVWLLGLLGLSTKAALASDAAPKRFRGIGCLISRYRQPERRSAQQRLGLRKLAAMTHAQPSRIPEPPVGFRRTSEGPIVTPCVTDSAEWRRLRTFRVEA